MISNFFILGKISMMNLCFFVYELQLLHVNLCTLLLHHMLQYDSINIMIHLFFHTNVALVTYFVNVIRKLGDFVFLLLRSNINFSRLYKNFLLNDFKSLFDGI